jgi:serine/threonine-protein kinase
MVLELLHGEVLRAHCERGAAQDVLQTLGWIAQTCEGLAAAHAERIVHRDLKPDNLLVSEQPDGTEIVKLLDFGIARALDAPSSLTHAGGAVGSHGYMSPEQLRDSSSADERSDIWSLGAVMYELLAGRPPFWAADAVALSAQVFACRPRSLAKLCPDLPEAVGAVVHRCLALDPARRFVDVGELAQALEALHPWLARFDASSRIRRCLARRGTDINLAVREHEGVRRVVTTELRSSRSRDLVTPRRRAARLVCVAALWAMLALLWLAFGPSLSGTLTRIEGAAGSLVRAGERVWFSPGKPGTFSAERANGVEPRDAVRERNAPRMSRSR